MRKKTLFSLLTALLLLLPLRADAKPGLEEVRILLSASITSASFSSEGTVVLKSPENGALLNTGRISKAIIGSHFKGLRVNNLVFPVRSVKMESNNGTISFNGKKYKGYFILYSNSEKILEVVNHVDMETYLEGVIPFEMSPAWPMEALKAQAVAARTYALYKKSRNGNKHYHLVSDVNDQVYSGLQNDDERIIQALEQTRGMVLTYKDSIAKTYYHSTCGARTAESSEVFSDIEIPYLKSVPCRFDRESPHKSWQLHLSFAEISDAFSDNGLKIDGITGITADGFTRSGRVRKLNIRTENGVKSVEAHSFRQILGPNLVKSTWFRLNRDKGGIILRGRGYGHGVGLCQWGAKGMAQKNYNFRSILAYYYPGTVLKTGGLAEMGN